MTNVEKPPYGGPEGTRSRLAARFLGEFTVIVVGVLVALALDSWVDDRAARQDETEARILLRSEFELNSARLDTVRAAHQRTLDAAYELLELMDTSDTWDQRDRLPGLVWTFVSPSSFDPIRGGLNSLIQSGQLGLIRDESLRAALAGWPDIVADMHEDEQEQWRYTFDFLLPFLMESGVSEELYRSTGRLRRLEPDPQPIDIGPLLLNPQFRDLISTRIMHLHILLDEVHTVESSIQSVLELLDAPPGAT